MFINLPKKTFFAFSFSTNLSLEKKALPKKLVFLLNVFACKKYYNNLRRIQKHLKGYLEEALGHNFCISHLVRDFFGSARL